MSVTGGPGGDAEVVARSPRPRRSMIVLAIMNTAYVALWSWRFGGELGSARPVALAVGAVVLVAATYVLVRLYRRRGGTRLVLTGDELRLERRVRPVVVRREDVVAVRGDVPGRPTWSERVLVLTRTGVVTLPHLDRPPAALIAALQGWSGVGEDAHTPGSSPAGEGSPV